MPPPRLPKGNQPPMPRMKRDVEAEDAPQGSEWKENLVALIVVAIVAVSAYLLLSGTLFPEPVPVPLENRTFLISTGGDPRLGSDDAPVTIIAFIDYDSPSCNDFMRDTLPRLKMDYLDPGTASLVIRNFPLEIHADALPLAIAATCADDQGKFWEMHDAIFAHDGAFTSAWMGETARHLGLDAASFAACNADPATASRIDEDVREAITAGGVSSVPTFFIDGRRLVGNRPYEEFTALIDRGAAQSGKI